MIDAQAYSDWMKDQSKALLKIKNIVEYFLFLIVISKGITQKTVFKVEEETLLFEHHT